jgi:DNA-binding transcriptional LysR family regulator
VHDAEAVLRPAERVDIARLTRTFTLRTSEGFVETFGPPLLARVAAEAPGVRLRFVPKLDKESALLRDGEVDLETGVVGRGSGPEVRAQALFRDRFVGVVRAGHALARGKVTAARYASAEHVAVSRRGVGKSPLDQGLEASGLERQVRTVVSGFSTALALARGTDLVASVPEQHTAGLRAGMHTFALPFDMPGITVSLQWHPRMDTDPAHRWLRGCVRETCAVGAHRRC